MSIDSAISIAWDVLKSVVAPIKRHFGYVIYSKRHAQDLQKEVEELAYEVDRVHHVAEEARHNLRNVYSRVTEWHASAETALKEARDLVGDFQGASKTCCYGTLPDPKCRYQFSRKAKNKIEVIQELTGKCSGFKEFNDISSSNPAPGNVAALTPAKREGKDVIQSATVTASPSFASTLNKVGDNGVFESRASIIRDIMDALADDSNSVVGVHGMGGVGKSTLLADVERRIMEEKSFDWVTKADVSENPDIKKIQGEIADALGLTEIKDKETTSGRAKLLHGRLKDEEKKKKKVLIILDNLWKGLDLKSVGIPCGHDNKVIGCKLLLTSRFQDVLQREMGCDRDFRLEELKDEEAKRLFERTVGDKVHDDPFNSLVDEAVQKCAGLPFLIIAMANIFKHADIPEWKDVLRQIEKSTNRGISERINEMLQLSYDRFKGEDGKEVKLLLRLCVVYGVPRPSLENLVRYSVGSRLFREDNSMEEVRDRMSSLVQTLKASSLLLKDDEDVDGFKIHDLVRGFVASVASRDDPLLVLKDNDKSVIELPKDKLKSCTAVCFPYLNMKELPEELDCPEMRIFLLFTNNESLKVPNSYFNSMKKLTVLHLSQVCLSHSPLLFQFLENLHTLCLDGCSLDDVAMIGELKRLHILSFLNSKIRRLPKEIGQLVELRLLDLNHCSQLEIIEPGVLGSLMKLEELYMENSFNRWNVVKQTPPTNAKLIELNNLKNLYTLHVSILDPSRLPEDLNVEKFTKYKIQIGDAWKWPKHRGSSTLQVKLDPISNILQKGFMQTFLGKTNDLFLDGSNGIEQSICKLSQEGFPKLKHLHVENSPSIHYVLQSPSHTNFKTLESLLLKNLINLEKICNYFISSKSFIALKVIRVESCDKMEILFPLSLLRELPQLEEVRAIKCNLVREIVEVDDCGKVELRNLHVLELRDLPNTKNFFTIGTTPSSSTSNYQVGTQVAFFNKQRVSIPSLESLVMDGLPNLEELWTDESPLGLSNLQFLVVASCKSLSKVINSRSLIKLQKLHTLMVQACISVQEIFDLDGAGVNIEILSELNTIFINGLPSLRCVWNKNPCGIVRFHNLKKLHVYDCDNLGFLFFPSMVESLVQLRELSVWHCKNMEAIIMEEEGLRVETLETLVFPMLTILDLRKLESLTCFSHRKCTPKAQGEDSVKLHSPILFNQEVAFPSLETSNIGGMDNIEKIWDNQVAADFFHKLKSLEVWRCNKLLNIVPSCILEWLKSLESLEVRSCDLLEVVFKLQPLNPLDGHPIAHLPLKRLKLDGLPELKCVWDKELHSQVKFQCLRLVTVFGCKNLVSLFPASVAIHLNQLEKLEVIGCGIVELIEKEDGLVPRFVFPKLTSVKLQNLTKLRCIYIGKYVSHWPALKTLKMRGCHKVEILASHPENDMPFDKQPLFLVKKVAFPSLETLDINGMDNIEIIWDNQVAADSFHKLESLEVRRCNKLLNIVPSCILGRLKSLESLQVRSCDLLEVVFKLQPLNPLDGHPIAHLPLKRLELDRLPKLKCVWDKEIHSQVKFQSLRFVIVSECKNLTSLFPASVVVHLTQLEELEVRSCDLLEVVFKLQPLNPLDAHPVADLPLKTLVLRELPKLKCVWDKELHSQVKFQCLRFVTVSECKSLASLFPASVAIHLTQLEELEVHKCGIVELIDKEDGRVPRFVFPKLTSLKLKHLTELKCIYIGKHTSHWPALKTLKVHGCHKVEILASYLQNEMPLLKQPLFIVEKGAFSNLQELKLKSSKWMEIWHGNFLNEELFCKLRVLELCCILIESAMCACRFVQSLTNLEELVICELYLEELSINVEAVGGQSHQLKVVSLISRCNQHLKTLDVSHCNVSNMFTSTIARNLVELTKLRISNCHMLIEVITEEGGKEGHVVAFKKLKYMELDGLKGLRCFSSGGHILMFPLLEDVTVTRCPNMKFFSEGPIEAPKLERVQVSKKEWFWKENLNTTIQSMFEQMGIIAGVKFVRLSEFSKLIERWHNELIPINSYWHLKYLVVCKCPLFVNAIPSRLMLVLGKMKALQVCDCESLEEIFSLEGRETMKGTQVLPQLELLVLVNLPKLRRLWNKNLQGELHFNSLTILGLYNCSNLRHAFAPSMVQCLANLEQMVIKKCGQMEGVIAEEEGQGSAMEKITFMNLSEMKLEWLPHFTSFLLGNNYMLYCPGLQKLTIAHCSKMRSFTQQSLMEIDHDAPSLFNPQVQLPQLKKMVLSHLDDLSKIWTDNPQETLTFDCLKKIEAKNCKSLENLFPLWVARNLSQIKKLRIESCMLKEIVARGDPPSVNAQFLFSELTSLVLHDMPQLKSFCPNFPTLNWSFLEELRVTHCDKLNIFSVMAFMNKWAQRDDQHDLSNHEAHFSLERDILVLERLLLVDKDIQMLLDGKFPDDIFGKPKALTLACFHDRKAVFPPRFLLERFRNLQSLEVFCCSFEDIFPNEGLVDEGLHPVLENLSELKLSKLHNIKYIWREDYLLEKILQSIETFEVWDCPNLTTVFPSMASFRNLTKLVVKNLFGLVHLIKFSAITNLVHLTEMTIIECERMKEVMANDGKGGGEVISLEKLETLRLQNLPSLVCFSSTESCIFRFPSLDSIDMEECPKMKIFSKGVLSTPKLRYVILFRYLWDVSLEGDLNTAIQKLSS